MLTRHGLLGAVLLMLGVEVEWLALVWLGGVVGGAGFGASFAGHLRLIGPHVQAHERAGVFAGVYTTAYLSFGIPAIIAGQLVTHVGLLPTVEGYGAVVLAAAVVGILVQLALARAERSVAEEPVLLATALTGCYDYEFLAAIPPREAAEFTAKAKAARVPVARIGRLVRGRGGPVVIGRTGRPMNLGRASFDHFGR